MSILGFAHQFVVFLKGHHHGFPLCIVLKQKKNTLCQSPALVSIHDSISASTHIARGFRHGRAPLHRLRRAGPHGFRPAVVEPAGHRCLVATAWPDGGAEADVSGSAITPVPGLRRASYVKSLLFVESKICQLQRQLDKRVRMQLFLFDGSFSESREGVAQNLQVLCLGNRRLLVRRPRWQRFSVLFCFFFTGRTHRLIVLFFGIADVSPDFFIHCKHQLLGRRQDSDRV